MTEIEICRNHRLNNNYYYLVYYYLLSIIIYFIIIKSMVETYSECFGIQILPQIPYLDSTYSPYPCGLRKYIIE
mgnify:CR=1 FL=1